MKAVPIFFFAYEARPLPQSEDFGQCGGAYINCWVKAESEIDAIQMAVKDIKENKWEIVAVEKESRVITDESYVEDPSGLEYYQSATLDGECYVYHRWPNELQDEDVAH